MCVCVFSHFSCVQLFATLWTGFSVRGIFQARILEWIAISSSRGSSWPRDQTHNSLCLPHWQADSLPLCHLGSHRISCLSIRYSISSHIVILAEALQVGKVNSYPASTYACDDELTALPLWKGPKVFNFHWVSGWSPGLTVPCLGLSVSPCWYCCCC